MLKILICQPDTIAKKLDKSNANARSNKKLAESKSKKSSKSRNPSNSKGMKKPNFLISEAKQTFNKALILSHFDLKCYIRIETNASSYVVSGILSQLILHHLILDSNLISIQSDFDQWHLVVYFFRKMISRKT